MGMVVVVYLYPRKTKDGRSRNFAFIGFRIPGGGSARKFSGFFPMYSANQFT